MKYLGMDPRYKILVVDVAAMLKVQFCRALALARRVEVIQNLECVCNAPEPADFKAR